LNDQLTAELFLSVGDIQQIQAGCDAVQMERQLMRTSLQRRMSFCIDALPCQAEDINLNIAVRPEFQPKACASRCRIRVRPL